MSSPDDTAATPPANTAATPPANTAATPPANTAATPPGSKPRTNEVNRRTEPSAGGVVETPSALPSRARRAIALVTIMIGGVCGALIGYGFGDISCSSNDCSTATGALTLLGATVGAGGVAIVAILALRAMDEWESLGQQSQARPRRKQRR